ncbi:MAG: CPBP family intramembrane glutamic endopeptidase [Gemmatimonadaceae bacterium]
MTSLHFSSWFFLAFMTFVLPYGAIATARRTQSAAGPANIGSRSQLHLNATITQVLIFGIAWYAALLQGLRFLGPVHLTARDLLAGVVTLAVMGGMAWISQRLRSEDERRRLWVLGLLPRTFREGAPFVLLAALGAISEELAYRGVTFALCTMLTGSAIAGALIAALLFAVVHYPQGGKSMAVIFGIALLKQALVVFTGTLWVAIGVHFTYNVLAAVGMARRAREAQWPDALPPHD